MKFSQTTCPKGFVETGSFTGTIFDQRRCSLMILRDMVRTFTVTLFGLEQKLTRLSLVLPPSAPPAAEVKWDIKGFVETSPVKVN